MNTRELVQYIKTIADNIPIVMSFNDTDPYTYWNSQEVKYGSVIFAVKGYNQLSGVTRYNCVIYYGDRVLKDESNVNNIYTDAQTTINTIITNVELSDGTITVVSGSPSITFFRQRFLDELAGGYCNFTVEADDAIGACGYGHGDIISPDISIEIAILEEKIKKLTAEVSRLEAEIGVKDKTIAELRAKIAELEKEIAELRKGLQPLLDRIAELEAEITNLNNEINSLEDTISQKNALIAEKDATITSLQNQIADKDATITSLQNQIADKDTAIAGLENEISSLNTQIAGLQSQIDSLNSEINNLNDTIAQKDSTISSLNTQIAGLQSQIDSLNSEISDLENTIAQKDSTIADLQNQITTLNNTISEKNELISSLQNQIDTLNKKTVNYMFGQVQSTSHVFYYDGDDGGDYSAIIAELPQGWTAVAVHNFTINATPADADIQINYN